MKRSFIYKYNIKKYDKYNIKMESNDAIPNVSIPSYCMLLYITLCLVNNVYL